MSAHDALLDLLNRYAYTIDSGDLEGFAALFTHGAWVMEGGVAEHGKEALLKGTANIRLYADGTPRTRHTTSNVELEVNETAGTARGCCGSGWGRGGHDRRILAGRGDRGGGTRPHDRPVMSRVL